MVLQGLTDRKGALPTRNWFLAFQGLNHEAWTQYFDKLESGYYGTDGKKYKGLKCGVKDVVNRMNDEIDAYKRKVVSYICSFLTF